jgi:MFS transporter, PPP family, 3-phenylpropionic acid transporter
VVVFGAVLQAAGIGWFPLLVMATCALLWLASLRVPSRHEQSSRFVAAQDSPPVASVLLQREVLWFFAAIFFTVLAHTSLYSFFSLYLDGLNYGKSAIGGIWAVGVVAEILFFRFQGRWFERLKPAQWLQVSAAVSVLRFALIAAAGQWWPVLVFTSLLHAVTFAAQHVAIIIFINQHFGGALRGRGQALYTVIGYGASGVIGGLAGGWLITHQGLASVFWAAAGAAAVGWWCARRAAK